MYAIVIGVISVVAYFVIKMAVKDALKEYNNEKNKQEQYAKTGEKSKETKCDSSFLQDANIIECISPPL